jgi:hypothetical protein
MPKRSSKKKVIEASELMRYAVALTDNESIEPPALPDGRNPAAVMLGRLGGLVGGRKRAEALSPERRSEIAKKAAAARWKR